MSRMVRRDGPVRVNVAMPMSRAPRQSEICTPPRLSAVEPVKNFKHIQSLLLTRIDSSFYSHRD